MGKISDQPAVTTLAGGELVPVVVAPNSGSTDPHRISATDLATALAALGGFSLVSTVSALDARVVALEQGGVIQSDTSVVSIAGTAAATNFTTLALNANDLAVGDRLIHFAQGDFLNDSAGSVVVDFDLALGATPNIIAKTPTAGFGCGQNTTATTRRAWQAFHQITVLSSTSFNMLGMYEMSSLPAAVGDPVLFNGTTTSRHLKQASSDAAWNVTNAITLKFRGTHRTAGTGTDIVLRQHEAVWSVIKA